MPRIQMRMMMTKMMRRIIFKVGIINDDDDDDDDDEEDDDGDDEEDNEKEKEETKPNNVNTVLHKVAEWGDVEILNMLLENKENGHPHINQQNDQGHTPLYKAVYKGASEAVAALIEAGGKPKRNRRISFL